MLNLKNLREYLTDKLDDKILKEDTSQEDIQKLSRVREELCAMIDFVENLSYRK